VKLKINIDDKTYEVDVEAAEPEAPQVLPRGHQVESSAVRVLAAAPVATPAAAGPVNEDKVCRSPVSGIVVRIAVQPGQTLQVGDVLIVLEAMSHEDGDEHHRAYFGQSGRHQGAAGRRRASGPDRGGVRIMAPEQIPGFLFFDHVAVSVKPGELENQLAAYRAMGFREVHREEVLGTDQVREVLLQVGHGPNLVQLIEPLNAESPVAKQIEKNGGRGGLAHVALRVADIQKAFDAMQKAGFKLIDKAPRPGSRGTTVFFVHPKTTERAAFGYVIEVVQEGPHG
jgi:methylmalonyl-CoA/ethylmalonyl-CoA epimerase